MRPGPGDSVPDLEDPNPSYWHPLPMDMPPPEDDIRPWHPWRNSKCPDTMTLRSMAVTPDAIQALIGQVKDLSPSYTPPDLSEMLGLPDFPCAELAYKPMHPDTGWWPPPYIARAEYTAFLYDSGDGDGVKEVLCGAWEQRPSHVSFCTGFEMGIVVLRPVRVFEEGVPVYQQKWSVTVETGRAFPLDFVGENSTNTSWNGRLYWFANNLDGSLDRSRVQPHGAQSEAADPRTRNPLIEHSDWAGEYGFMAGWNVTSGDVHPTTFLSVWADEGRDWYERYIADTNQPEMRDTSWIRDGEDRRIYSLRGEGNNVAIASIPGDFPPGPAGDCLGAGELFNPSAKVDVKRLEAW